MPISSAAFLAGVSGLLRIERLLREEYRNSLLGQEFVALLPGLPSNVDCTSHKSMVSSAKSYIVSQHPGLLDAGKRFDKLIRDPQRRMLDTAPGDEIQIDDAIKFYLEQLRIPLDYELADKRTISRSIVLSHRDWLGEGERPRWGRLGIELVNIALGIVSVEPQILGLNRRATEIFSALAANLTELVANNDVAGDGDVSVGERLVRSFAQASLETVVERPELFISAERWRPIVQGIVVPLKTYIGQTDQGGLREFFAGERIREFLRGPLAHSVLNALEANAEEFLTGKFGDDQVLGAVSRAVLGVVTSADPSDFDLRRLFSGQGAVLVYNAALGVARDRPEVFVGGDGAAAQAQREWLRKVADTLVGAPLPFQRDNGLAPQIAAITIGIAGDYAARRLREGADSAWETAGADVAEHLISEIVGGFKDGLTAGAANPFERLFSQEQAVDILRIVASHAAATPEMVIGSGGNPEARSIAAGVAAMLSDPNVKLLDGASWRSIAANAVELAARNPGTLLGLTGSGPEDQIAVVLVRSVLTQAAANIAGDRRQGSILFGETLNEVISITLQAAASNLFITVDPAANIVPPEAATNAKSLEAFIAHLLKLAADEDNVELRMSADEWLYVYRYFVTHVLAHGPLAFLAEGQAAPADDSLLITDQMILNVLQTLVTKPPEGDVG